MPISDVSILIININKYIYWLEVPVKMTEDIKVVLFS